jgi:hypothetical protein
LIGGSMAFNEIIGADRTEIPLRPTDTTLGRTAASYAYSRAGQDDYVAAQAGFNRQIPAEFRGFDSFELLDSGAIARPGETTAPESSSGQAAAATEAPTARTGTVTGAGSEVTRAPVGVDASAWAEVNTNPAVAGTLPEVYSAPAGAAAAPETSIGGQTAAATQAPEAASAAATTANGLDTSALQAQGYTPEQIAAATVSLSTPVVKVGPDGQLTESTSVGSGVVVDGADGQQYVYTNGHVVSATGQDGTLSNDGSSTYAEGPTTATFSNGTQEQLSVVANNSSLAPENSVQIGNNADVALLPIPSSDVLQPFPSVTLSNETPAQGDTITSYGYPNGPTSELTTVQGTYEGMTSASQITNNSADTSSMIGTSGGGVYGMSGGPQFDSNGNVVSMYTEGTGSNTLGTPSSIGNDLINSQNPFSPNYLYNQFNYKPQPIATPDDPGNGSNQDLTGITLNKGDGTTQYIPQTPPSSDASPPTNTTTPPPSDASPPTNTATPPPSDTSPPTNSATPPPSDASPPTYTLPTADNPPATAPPIDNGSGGYFDGGGGGDFMAMD